MRLKIVILLMGLGLLSCQKGHDHEGHVHGAEEKVLAVDYTVWTDKTELFVEFPVLVVGQPSQFAAHFTVLKKHQAVKDGSLIISLVNGKDSLKVEAKKPLRDGIFLPTMKPVKSGVYQLVFDVSSPQLVDRIVIDGIQVFESIEMAKKAIKEGEEPSISFLKEQAWKIDFQTEQVKEGDVYEVIQTSGVWRTSASDVKTLVANTHGKVDFKIKSLVQGTKVKKGQVLINLSAEGFTENNHDVEIKNAETNLEQAKAEFERSEKLFQLKVVPLSAFEKAKQKYELALSSYKKLTEGYDEHHGKSISAPFDGYIQSVIVENGEFVDEGASLLQIVAKKSGLLEVHVSQSEVGMLDDIQNIYYQPRSDEWSDLKSTNGKVLSTSRTVSTEHPMLSVFASVNDGVQFPEGAFTGVQLVVGNPKKGLVVPQASLMENYGSYAVIVQLSGEGFEKRDVKIGARFGDSVEIVDGLRKGEMIVSLGAYQVKMASMSGAVPAHYH